MHFHPAFNHLTTRRQKILRKRKTEFKKKNHRVDSENGNIFYYFFYLKIFLVWCWFLEKQTRIFWYLWPVGHWLFTWSEGNHLVKNFVRGIKCQTLEVVLKNVKFWACYKHLCFRCAGSIPPCIIFKYHLCKLYIWLLWSYIGYSWNRVESLCQHLCISKKFQIAVGMQLMKVWSGVTSLLPSQSLLLLVSLLA